MTVFGLEMEGRIGAFARRVGARLGMEDRELVMLEQAALLRDVGNIEVPDAILRKRGPLDEEEWALVCRHPVVGAELLASKGLGDIAGHVRAHHERWDGRGYPDGVAGGRIPLAGRVIGACDAFEAMTADRPYRAALSIDEALAQLLAGAGTQFDPDVVEAVERERGGLT